MLFMQSDTEKVLQGLVAKPHSNVVYEILDEIAQLSLIKAHEVSSDLFYSLKSCAGLSHVYIKQLCHKWRLTHPIPGTNGYKQKSKKNRMVSKQMLGLTTTNQNLTEALRELLTFTQNIQAIILTKELIPREEIIALITMMNDTVIDKAKGVLI